jgi:adenine/guanine phosphoribosyltransferase-like PRPP-binding protein
MVEARLLQQFEELAERLGVKVLYESLDQQEFVVKSGTCTLRGQLVAIIDDRLTPGDRIRVLADCLSRFDLSTVYLVPAVRELIEARRTTPPVS